MSAESSLHDNGVSPATPVPAVGAIATLIDDDACAASGAYARGGIIDVSGARKVTFYVDYNPAGVGGRPAFLPLVSGEGAAPAAGDDSWFAMSVWDGAVEPLVLNGAVPAGADFTVAPDFGRCLNRKLLIIFEPADNATDEIRQKFTLNVEDVRWLQLLYAEDGNEGAPGTLTVKYSLAV